MVLGLSPYNKARRGTLIWTKMDLWNLDMAFVMLIYKIYNLKAKGLTIYHLGEASFFHRLDLFFVPLFLETFWIFSRTLTTPPRWLNGWFLLLNDNFLVILTYISIAMIKEINISDTFWASLHSKLNADRPHSTMKQGDNVFGNVHPSASQSTLSVISERLQIVARMRSIGF